MLIHRLKVSGLLSFGPNGVDLPMQPLNVLIGPNGSGKSNFLEATKIDALVAKVREAIDRLRELRTALISAAVTGKIDVREAVP